MGKTSSQVKDRYRAKAYDMIQFAVPKGEREKYKAYAAAHGESLASFLKRAIQETMERDSKKAEA